MSEAIIQRVDALAYALGKSLGFGIERNYVAFLKQQTTTAAATPPPAPTTSLHLVGWLLKWEGWQDTALLERDEDPRTKTWGDDPPDEIIDLYAHLFEAPKPPPPKVAGRVTLRQDWEDLPRGSSLANLRDLGDKWLCDWPTSSGTMSNIEVPKNLCTEPKDVG